MNNLGHISSDPRLLESFNSYKIFTLELISAFCNLKRIKAKSAENQNNNNISVKTNNDSLNDTQSENSSLIILGSQSLSSPVVFSASQELKIINLILRSIKNTDLNVNELVDEIYADSCNETGKEFGKHLLDRIDRISGDTLLELRNLMSDLKIYVIGPNLTDPLIRPWSVLGKYVRRCVIVYERMQFDKLVEICKRASGQFKQLSRYIYRSRAQHEMRSSESNAANSNSANAAGISMAVIPGSNSASLFLHEESNLTITSEWFNRSANAVDCSGMDLEPLDESINPQNQGNTSRIVSEIRLNPLDQKALTSTASAQRTQQSAFKSLSGKQQVTFQLPVTKLGDSSPFRVEATPIDADSNLMPPPQLASDQMVKNQLISSSQRIQAPITNGFAFSRKLAEYFVAKQAFLLENNEHEALAPYELEYKLDELIHNDPTFVDAYYLRFLNFLRLNDYPSALKALHDYFDRFILTSSVSLAALNLCSLEFRFGNRDNSLFALKEAITSAHQEGDNICLQHCLSWLYKIDHFNNADSSSRKNFLIKSSCSRSINYELFTLATYNLHYLARNSIGKKEPQTILSVLNKTDIANLKMNSKVELNLLSQCHKACLWGLYGHKKISSLFSQMLLTFSPKSNQNKLNTESQCIAMCYLAIEASQNGQYSMSQNILSKCKEIYSSYTKTNHHFLFAENTIAIEKNLLQGKWSLCRWHIQKIATVNIQQACLHEMNIYIIESNFERAKEIGAKILSLMNRGIRQETADLDGRYSYFNAALDTNNNSLLNEQLNISLRFNFIQIYIGLREYSNALILAIKLYHEIKQVDFHYELMTCCLLVAKILIHMEHPEQAIKYIQKCIIFILSNGSLLDQAKMHYIYAKCLHLLDKRKNIQACISHMFECVKKLESIQGSIYLISAYAYLSLLLNESGNFEERNLYAGKFRRLREQLPLINYLL